MELLGTSFFGERGQEQERTKSLMGKVFRGGGVILFLSEGAYSPPLNYVTAHVD